jgi:basic amino acid/polyamine antiporter, APA family
VVLMSTESKPAVAHFTRNATGLVRDIKVRDAVIFNVLPAAPGLILAVSMFWILSAFTGVNIYVAILITVVCSLLVSGAFAFLSQIMPRSGGEYILLSRSLHPALAVGGSILIGASSMLSIGYWGVVTAQVSVGPMLTSVGVAADSQRLQDWGTSVASKPWDFWFGVGMTIVFLAIMISGTRLLMRVQLWLFCIGMAGLVGAAITLLTTSRSDFISSYNSYAQPFTHRGDTYHYLITKAHEAGVQTGGATDWHNTIIASGAFIAFGVWTWFSAQFAGEVRQAGTRKNWYSMLYATAITFGTLLLMTVLLYHTIGREFLTAASAVSGDPSVYTLPSPPWWNLLVATIHNNTLFVAFLSLTFIAWGPLVFYIQFIQPVRALFAWSFDQLIPERIAEVNERTHTPIVSLLIVGIAGIPFIYLAAYTDKFFTVIAAAALVGFPVMFMVGIGAILFPYRKRAIYEASAASNMSLGGVPVMALFGAGSILVSVYASWVFLENPELGLPGAGESLWHQIWARPTDSGLSLAIWCLIAGAVVYYAGKYWRRTQGIDVSLNYLEIPPE